ncbi:enoyl-CoA hydratase/isomerase family protein [Clostridium sp. MT-14]|uniref:enoyl-CoA hydratase/isomerase family protein n=1 Tax=unclassified Clostridium TaxID=2614128 RepID=UPI00123AA715|nr:enoyl-CoA hydratase-related protein [Clostridium sp. HV4-5-A1G]KAA8674950.1 crotonase [Clostridium sp. HV4-5-A1G]CAB1255309.1 Short-chain-enoyl-CoA hydratase [Clostridiaceae bacterium BL-3]
MKNLSFEMIGRIGVVRINRPRALNALNKPTVEELDELIEKIKKDSEIKVLIIGSDNNFAAGADIKGMVNCNVEEAKDFSFSKTFQKIYNLEIPTIAAIDGYALGGGLELALACDFRIASTNAKVGFPEINLGIMPGAGGTIRAPRLLGVSRAKELIFFGEMISADRAEQMGLVNKIVEQEKLMEVVMEWAEKLCKKPPVALRVAKKTIDAGISEPKLNYAIKMEYENWADLFNTEDQKEGMRAFIEKRQPIYQGK